MSDFDLRKHFKKQYLNENEEYTKYDVLRSLIDLLKAWPDFEHPYYIDVKNLVDKFNRMNEEKEIETDYEKRRKEEDDYYQDQEELKERIGFSGPDYQDEVSMTLKAINSNIHSKALAPGEPIVKQIGNKLDDILALINSLPEKGQMGKIGFRK